MKNASEVSLKIDGCEISRCELLENYRPDSSDNDFASNGNGSFVNQKAASASARYEAETARKIDKSIVYMRQHLDKPLQASVLATLVNISTSHFFALFKRHTGCAPIDYFTRLRMHQACRLLDSTSSRVKEIADVLGYGDPFYFSRVFKSVNHVAPSEYRGRQKRARAEAGRGSMDGFFFQAKKTQKTPNRTSLAVRPRAAILSSADTEKCAL